MVDALRAAFDRNGWVKFAYDKAIAAWVDHVTPLALEARNDPEQIATWLRAGGTWFVGVNAIANDGQGHVGGGPALTGALRDFTENRFGWYDLDRAQVSITYPGYPQRDPHETDAGFRYRRDRDAAHLDGLKPELSGGGRCVAEAHAYVIGIPLNRTDDRASPLVLWEGSHLIMRKALRDAFEDVPADQMRRHDVTQAYQAARREVFETCSRITVHATPGEAYLMDRFTLHGVAPWQDGAKAPSEGRMIAYFRPDLPGGVSDWLTLP
ncbi:hypothetical protein [Aliiroseovarius sp. PrR006]|uniref:hypothetical protein n=1 Tax=Aliiroseovarius sp. PrR006 TaxID=2706883 RepID=UPI0013D2E84B|nr:hypothetical protein [Aliiroseovarius sp. PrR006]NDW52301.1 hypothetical protein [Aliiroseovarius sp. PrR006]